MTYQGWTNYETWNVALWVNNDEAMYREMKRQGRYKYTAAQAERLCRSFFPNGTKDMASDDHWEPLTRAEAKARMDLVNWQEIADDFNGGAS